MTIDEAIARERIKTHLARVSEDLFLRDKCMWSAEESHKRLEEHEQIVEWLEDYKRIKMLTPIEQVLKAEYNKAIDDFVKFASDMPTVEEEDGTIRPMWLEEMAEQLKAGGENE